MCDLDSILKLQSFSDICDGQLTNLINTKKSLAEI